MEDDLLPIGQFARLGRLSVKQLRHYDELGLLRPAYVDAGTGYRYYRAAQAREALAIGLLRSMDVPLAVVARVLAGGPGALAPVRDDLEAELARRRRMLAVLERVMAEGLPSAPVRLVAEPARRAAVVREVARGPEDIGRATSAAVRRVLGAVPAVGDGVRLIGLFPADLGEVVEVSVARVLGDEESGGAEVEVLPGGVFACATHFGPYEQISLTAHAVLAWCAERRHGVRGPIREVYVSDPAVTPPESLTTDVMVAVEEEQ
ncbi:DNA-binding transcriptional MerR regulator [Nonomuraea polychroma]|uniref:DNA-binding transcriptional MerR regulator n=1 Tax=Nonomuraea polychroma TaxID=46176 RepID=A0A438M5K3_9ACTN|nr:GyrI-like domain-containing protein [Nonomuraea polychroma]RVX40718.1 DNA-binding transcriptional MerR regulator [Nonomuraea polychroma]